MLRLLALASTLLLSTAALPQQRGRVQLQRIHELEPGEGVFAYARISPDGRHLVYASESRDPRNSRELVRTIRLLEVATRKVLFTEEGIDAYWSPSGDRMIYLSRAHGVSIRHHPSGRTLRDVAPADLGDYFSWAQRDGKDLIVTIRSRYYELSGDQAVLPNGAVRPCPGIGVGSRPLVSKDGKRLTTFVRGTVVVRGLADCDSILDTGIRGAKADFSFDGRYIAFHAPRREGIGYELNIVDLRKRTLRRVPMSGSALFPSWTRDGRLCFRYDGDDYRGFMIARGVLSVPEEPLPAVAEHLPAQRRWSDVFPGTQLPSAPTVLVTVWSAWSAHVPDALRELQRARTFLADTARKVAIFAAVEPGTSRDDARRLLETYRIDLPELVLPPDRFTRTEAVNQIPTTLLFRDGVLVESRLGALSYAEIVDLATPRH